MSADTKYHSLAVALWHHHNGEIKPTLLYRENGTDVEPDTVISPRWKIRSNVIVIRNCGKNPFSKTGYPCRAGVPLWQMLPNELLPNELEQAFREACTKLVMKADAPSRRNANNQRSN